MITIQDLFWLIPSASVLALLFAGIFFYRMKAPDEGNEVMKMIARHVRSGAMAYLRPVSYTHLDVYKRQEWPSR